MVNLICEKLSRDCAKGHPQFDRPVILRTDEAGALTLQDTSNTLIRLFFLTTDAVSHRFSWRKPLPSLPSATGKTPDASYGTTIVIRNEPDLIDCPALSTRMYC